MQPVPQYVSHKPSQALLIQNPNVQLPLDLLAMLVILLVNIELQIALS